MNPINEAVGEALGRAIEIGSSMLFLPKRGIDAFFRIFRDEAAPGAAQKIDDLVNAGKLGNTLGSED